MRSKTHFVRCIKAQIADTGSGLEGGEIQERH